MLGPLLFNILFDGISEAVRAACPGVALGRDIHAPRVTVLLYADDLVVLAKNQRDLQRALDAIGAWGARWRFSFGIGPEKTAVLVVGSKFRDFRFSLQGLDVPVVAEYCYLCVVFQPSRKWNKHTDRLVGKGNRKFHQSIAGQKTAVCIQVFAAVCFVHTCCLLCCMVLHSLTMHPCGV